MTIKRYYIDTKQYNCIQKLVRENYSETISNNKNTLLKCVIKGLAISNII